ncbi:alpha/beta hydrolase [Alloalcanivorax gelatiniphagus]
MVALVVLPLVVVGYQVVGAAIDSKYARAASYVDVGGHRVHIECTGSSGARTVVLEAAAGGVAAYWDRVADALDDRFRVCSYDRAGLGWSEGPVEDLRAAGETLHGALARETGPFTLVGHSLGAIHVRAYQQRYPDEVSALVLVDGSHPDQLKRSPELAERARSAEAEWAGLMWGGRLGLTRSFFDFGGELDFHALPHGSAERVEALWSRGGHLSGVLDEQRASARLLSDLSDRSLGDLPLTVVSAGTGSLEGWDDMQADLARLSSNTHHVTIADADHMSLLFDPVHADRTAQLIAKRVEQQSDDGHNSRGPA